MPQDILKIIEQLQLKVNKGQLDIQRYHREIDKTQASIRDAEITLRTLTAMGVKSDDGESKTGKVYKSVNGLTTPDIIFTILSADGADPKGYEPMGVMKLIKETFGLEPDPNNVRPTLWRLAKRGRLQKDKRGRYRLPKKIEPADDLISRSVSAGSETTPAQGGVARLGGGT